MLTFPFLLTILFFIVLLGIAWWGMRQTADVHDFFLGGKTLGPWFLAFSYGTAYFSAVIFVGFAGKFGWQFGLNALWVGVANAVIGAGLAWLVLGKRTRRMTHNLNARTMPEFFSTRFETNGMKVITAVIIFVFLVPYSASVFTGLSYLFEIVFERKVSFTTVLTVISIVSFLYITGGGYKAIARIDFVLGLIMFVGSLLMVFVVARYFGGIPTAATQLSGKLAERLSSGEIKAAPWYILPSVVFMTSFGVWGLPQMVHKYYAIRNEKEIWRGAVISTVFAMLIGCAAYFTGAMTHLMEPETIPTVVKGGVESVDFDRLVPDLIAARLPQALLAVILLLVLSASLSTLSSLVLVSSSAITIDLYKGYVNPKATDRGELLLMRVLCGFFILTSYFIALKQPTWIVSLMSISWGAVAGSFLAPYLYGLFWRRTTKLGAYAGMWTGLFVSNGLYWYWFAKGEAGLKAPLAASIAMILPMIVVPVVSLMTKPPKSETIEKAFGAVVDTNGETG